MSKSSITRGILDIPDEILVEIVGYLHARDRLRFGESCNRFHSLVFNERRLLRDLNFSENGYLSSINDVQQYFDNKKKYEHIRKINVSNMYYTEPRNMRNTIGKAKNLVELNIMGLKFQFVKQLAIFLKPMECLRILSIEWPTTPIDTTQCCEMLQISFNRLTKLTMGLCDVQYARAVIFALEQCQRLRELLLLQRYENILPRREDSWVPDRPRKMENLQIAACCGFDIKLWNQVIPKMLPNLEQWMQFDSHDIKNAHFFYYGKNVEVSQEFTEVLKKNDRMTATGESLINSLLREVMEITQNDKESKKFPCLYDKRGNYTGSLMIDDIKKLLKNPRHQIHYLYLENIIEPESNVHLVGSAFPYLTKLVLTDIIRKKVTDDLTEVSSKNRRTSHVNYAEASGLNSSFAQFVKHTPHITDLTLTASSELRRNIYWDSEALRQIIGWRNLTILHLVSLSIGHGEFLIEIGKQCKNLEKLRLEHLRPNHDCNYKSSVYKMLPYCHNLKDLSIAQKNLGGDIFTVLVKNRKLRRVCIRSEGSDNRTSGDLVLSIQNLVQSCELVLLVHAMEGMSKETCDKIKSVLERLKDELHRPNFQFEIVGWYHWYERHQIPLRNHTLHYVHKDLLFPYFYTDSLFHMNCL